MLMRFPLWKIILVLAVLFGGAFVALPNVLSPDVRGVTEDKPNGWYPTQPLKLGLDLRGGASILLEIDGDDLRTNRMRKMSRDVAQVLRESPRISVLPQNRVVVPANAAEGQKGELRVKPSKAEDVAEAISRIRKLGNPPAGSFGGANTLIVSEQAGGWISVRMTDAALDALQNDALANSIEAVRRRVNNSGLVEPSIQKQGDDRILVEVPGLEDPASLIDVLTRAGVLTFNMVDEEANPADFTLGEARGGRIALADQSMNGAPTVVFEDPVIDGADLQNASQGFDQYNQPNINFQLNPAGAQRFGRATSENVGKRFAIVLDDQIISAPRIRSAITGGSGVIEGGFTIQEAQNLAIILRSGALPAKLKVAEQRQVGAGLGRDSIEKGVSATLVGLALVVVFMLVVYGLLGVFSVIGLMCNLVLLIGILSWLGATLTLPGIGGILLTLGMAVDANVLIYERIREEKRAGRSAISSAEAGFKHALSTILDANVTTLLASIILLGVGSGPVRGFAVTLSIGIVTSIFTAFVVTRLLLSTWLLSAKPKAIPI
ncbi:MAG: protein translocase subunit SecD [Hyphomonadaceae bacterium]